MDHPLYVGAILASRHSTRVIIRLDEERVTYRHSSLGIFDESITLITDWLDQGDIWFVYPPAITLPPGL